jgi:hypothetical protein
MKPATLALVVAGVPLLVGGIWVSLILPVRTEITHSGGGFMEVTHRKNAWGRELGYKTHTVQKWGTEVIPYEPNEIIFDGWLDWDGKWHGPWLYQERHGSKWYVLTQWYDHGDCVRIENGDTRNK